MVKKKEKNKNVSFLSRRVKVRISTLLFLAGVLIALFLLNSFLSNKKEQEIKKTLLPRIIKRIVNNKNTKFAIKNLKKTNGVYKFELNISDKKYTSYLTLDEKIIFVSGVKIKDLFNKKLGPTVKTKKTAKPVKKTKKSQ